MLIDGFEVTRLAAGEYLVKDVTYGTGREFNLKSHPVTGYWQLLEHGRKLSIQGEIDFYPRSAAYKALKTYLTVPPKARETLGKTFRARFVNKPRGPVPKPSQIVDVRFNRVGADRWVGSVGNRIFHLWRDEEGWWYGNEEGYRNFATRMESRKAAESELQYWLDAENP